MSASLAPDKFSLLQTQPVTVCQVMSLLGKANFCVNGHSQLWRLCHVIQSDMLTVYDSPTLCFLLFTFPFQHYVNWNDYLICNRAQFLCNCHLLMCLWLLLLMPHPLFGPFIFRDLGFHYQLVDPGLILCVGLILPCGNFRPLPLCCVEWLSAYLVRWFPCIWITTLLRLFCVIKVVQCLPFLSRLACQILSLTDRQYYSHSSVHFYPSQCGG